MERNCFKSRFWKNLNKEEALNKGSFRALLRFGFTLIELMVVVLIIGILAAIAVPQYRVAVEKSRLSEVLTTIDALKKAIDIYVLEHGLPKVEIYFVEGRENDAFAEEWGADPLPRAELDIEVPLDCSREDSTYCDGKYYMYRAHCNSHSCFVTAYRWLDDEESDGYDLNTQWNSERIEKVCGYEGPISEKICNGLSSLGWEPRER